MNKRVLYGLVGVCVIILLVAGGIIFFNSTPKATNAIKVGYMAGNMNGAPLYVASAKNFFKANNIQVEIVLLSSGSEVKQALSAGQIDIAFAGASNFLIPISKGVPIKVIAPMSFTHTYLYVRPDNEIKSFKDLEGKSIAISPGGINEYEIRRVLKAENIDTNTINFINLIDKVNRPIALMDKNAVDAVPIDYEDLNTYTKIGAVPLAEWVSKGYEDHVKLDTILTVNKDFMNNNPLLVEQFVDSLIDGERYIKENPQESAGIVSSVIKTDTSGRLNYSPDTMTNMWKNKIIVYTLWTDPQELVGMSNIAAEVGQIDNNLTLEQIYDLRFEEKLKAAQKEIYPAN